MDSKVIEELFEIVKTAQDRIFERKLTPDQSRMMFITSSDFRILHHYTTRHQDQFSTVISIWKWLNYAKKDLFTKTVDLHNGDSTRFRELFSLFETVPETEGYLAYGENLIIISSASNTESIREERNKRIVEAQSL